MAYPVGRLVSGEALWDGRSCRSLIQIRAVVIHQELVSQSIKLWTHQHITPPHIQHQQTIVISFLGNDVLWHRCILLACFQVVLIDVGGAIASAHGLLDLIGILHHVLQLILKILNFIENKKFIS